MKSFSKRSVRGLAALFAACVVAQCFSSHAAESKGWFNGGIGEDWPTNATMTGGAWCNGAETRAQMSGGFLHIVTDDEEPLVFEATQPKPLGSNDAATNVTISFSCAFQPYSRSALPTVPEDAKGAVILVTDEEDPDEASDGELYYAAYDSGKNANIWEPSGLTAATDEFVDIVMLISHGASGFINVKYTIMGQSTKAVPVLQPDASDALVSDVVYAGVGQASKLESTFKHVDPYRIGETEYADFESLQKAMQDGDTINMQLNDTLPAGATLTNHVTFVVGGYVLSMKSGYLTNAADVVFSANAASNLPLSVFVRTDRWLTLPVGTITDYSLLGEDFAYVSIDGKKWVRYNGKWQKMDPVTMHFYYPGYFDRAAVTLNGLFGDKIATEELDLFVESVETDEYVQDFFWDADTETLIDNAYWFCGTWDDAEGKTVEFPTRYATGDFYPNSTEIVHRIEYVMGVATNATNPNSVGYDIWSHFDLGDAATNGFRFVRWEDADCNKVTNVYAIALGRETGYLDDITLYAVWEPAATASTKLKTMTVAPGESAAYYDTAEAAQSAAAAINADKADGVLAPAGFTGDGAAYAANFAATANGTSISITLTEEAAAKIAKQINSDTLVAAELADPTLTTVTVRNAEPGFYYSIVGGTTLDSITMEGTRKLAQGSEVELEKPALGTTDSAFYRIKVTLDRVWEVGKEDQWRN